MIKKFIGPYVDYGEDLNLYIPEDKGKHEGGLSKSLFVDDTIKTVEIALTETKKKLAPYWLTCAPLLAAYVDEMGESFLFFIDEELKKRVVLVVFIDFYLPHSLRGLPYIKEWLKRYEGAGLTVVGVFNSPFELGKDLDLATKECHRLGIHFPMVVDHDFSIWRALENRYHPRRLLFSQDQKIIADYTGCGGYKELEGDIQNALRELSPGLAFPRLLGFLSPHDESLDGSTLQPATYFGLRRGRVGNSEELSSDGNDVIFIRPEVYAENTTYLTGPWMGQQNSIYVASGPYLKNQYQGDSSIIVTFKARQVFVLCASRNYLLADASSNIRANILLDGKPIRESVRGGDIRSEGKKQFITVHEPKLFEVVSDCDLETAHRLEIILGPETADNFEIFALYFIN